VPAGAPRLRNSFLNITRTANALQPEILRAAPLSANARNANSVDQHAQSYVPNTAEGRPRYSRGDVAIGDTCEGSNADNREAQSQPMEPEEEMSDKTEEKVSGKAAEILGRTVTRTSANMAAGAASDDSLASGDSRPSHPPLAAACQHLVTA